MFRSRLSAAPYLVWMVIFITAPLLLVCYFAFTDAAGQFTLANIQGLTEHTDVLLRSLWLAAVATVVCFVLGYPVAYILSRAEESQQKIYLMLCILPMWMNFLLRTYAWMTLLERNGLINRFFALFGLGPFEMINTQGAVVLGMVYNYLPFMIMPLYSIMVKIENSVIEAAQDLGASSLQVLLKVIFPLSVPGITSGVIMVFVPAISTFIISKMLGGGSNLLIGDLIELQFLGNAYNPNLGAAMSLVLMIIILICLGVMNHFGDEDAAKGAMM